MQTPGEKFLVDSITSLISSADYLNAPAELLNIGAGKSLSIEWQLYNNSANYICDRLDIDDCSVKAPFIRNCWQCSLEYMYPAGSSQYDAAFANYVLEHVENLYRAAFEIFRVLKPGGLFVATVPNTTSPEFILAKKTPLWLHKFVRQGHAWETQYAYNNINDLIMLFVNAGFLSLDQRYWPIIEAYLFKYPLLSYAAKIYDQLVIASAETRLMGDVCLLFQKPPLESSE